MISVINTETKRRLKNPKIQLLKDRYFLDFNVIFFFLSFGPAYVDPQNDHS